jgi:hypothetical protein
MEIGKRKLIELGMRAGDSDMYDEDLLWSRCSRDKVDIAEVLMGVIRALFRTTPRSRRLRVLSIGSGSEPQFLILESAFMGGVYLLDIDNVPLEIVNDRIKRQWIDHVTTVQGNYCEMFIQPEDADQTLKRSLGNERFDLITLHHSMYYCSESEWEDLFVSLYGKILCRRGAIHAVMMASESDNHSSTTWLYNHFAGKFFDCHNDQDLKTFGSELSRISTFSGSEFQQRTHEVDFFVDDFEKFMTVVWMILLYPDVHSYTLEEREEITEYIYGKFWLDRKPLLQMQDHLIINRKQ